MTLGFEVDQSTSHRPADQSSDAGAYASYLYFPDLVDLTPKMVETTQQTYQDMIRAMIYSSLEYKPDYILNMWNQVFAPLGLRDELLSLAEMDGEERPLVIVLGCGSGGDAVITALVGQFVEVIGIDISAALLEQAKKIKEDWEMIARVVSTLSLVEPKVFEWAAIQMKRLSDIYEIIRTQSEPTGLIPKDIQQTFLSRLSSRIKILEPIDFLNLPKNHPELRPNSAKLIMAHATLPHVPKSEISRVIKESLTLLKTGGKLSFDVRVDPDWSKKEKGRTFADNVLQGDDSTLDRSDGWRYFTTFTWAELWSMLEGIGEVVDVHVSETAWTIETIEDNKVQRYYVQFKSISEHPDKYKPKFFNVFITKMA